MSTTLFEIEDATREQLRLRMIIDGVSSSGKTATSLLFASTLAQRYGGEVVLIASEKKRDLSYVGTRFAPHGYKRIQLPETTSVAMYRGALNKLRAEHLSQKRNICCVVIDSLSHAWAGKGGLLEESDSFAKSEKEQFGKWQEVGKVQNTLIDDITGMPFHVIATLRTRTAWEFTKDDKGRNKPERIGLKPVQREGIEYEFGIYCRMDENHNIQVIKTDFEEIDRIEVNRPTGEFMRPIIEWLDTGRVEQPITEAVRLASAASVSEYIKLVLEMHGINEIPTRVGFQEKYGMFLEDTTQVFLDERIQALKDDKAKKPVRKLG